MTDRLEPPGLAEVVRSGDRRALARAITLVESAHKDDRAPAHALMQALLPFTGRSVRVGISGTPGVGKSTLIDALGRALVDQGKRVAVLAVDPSSPTSGGSILGDKTRMEALAQSELAFVRPSPSRGVLGGTAPHTREALLLCEAAGFDVVLVETVGVGQSEAAVRDLVDTFVLMVAPGGGDALQGVKRGVLELCDVIVVNKADGPLEEAAQKTQLDYEQGSRLFLRDDDGWTVPVLTVSAATHRSLDTLWTTIEAHRAATQASGAFERRRGEQAVRAMWAAVDQALHDEARADAAFTHALEEHVRGHRESALAAAAELLRRVRSTRPQGAI
jgi:LAO/AO transport system kinase